MTERDKAIFAIYCESWSTMVAMKKILKRDGEFIISKERVTEYPDGRIVRSGGVMIAHPALKQYNEAAERVRKALVEIGMSPSSRGRVSAAKDESDKQEQLQLDRFFK